MGHKIKTTVFDSHRNSYATDVHVEHSCDLRSSQINIDGFEPINQSMTGIKLSINLQFYRTKADKDAGGQPFQAVNNLDNMQSINHLQKNISFAEAAALNASAVNGYVNDYLVGLYGEINVEEVI